MAAHPAFSQLMTDMGEGFGWTSYKTTSADGYHLTMFRIDKDPLGEWVNDTMGPILLTPGMYSDTADWFQKDSPLEPSTPI